MNRTDITDMTEGNLARKLENADGNPEENPGRNRAYQRPVEYIDGRLVMMAPAFTNHNFTGWNIYTIFRNYLKDRPCTPFGDGAKVFLTERDHFVPDFMVVCDRDKIKWDGVHGAPDLVVEILSRSTAHNDRGRKMKIYGQCGVREYWIIDTRLKSVEQYVQKDGSNIHDGHDGRGGDTGYGGYFELREVYAIPEPEELESLDMDERGEIKLKLTCAIFPDLEIVLDEIFYGLLD